MDGKGMIRSVFKVLEEDSAERTRRKRSRMLPGIERQEDRVVLSRMGGMPGGYGGGFRAQPVEISSFDVTEVPVMMMGPGGPGSGMRMGPGNFGPSTMPEASAVEIQDCGVSMLSVMPASAQIMGSLAEAGVTGGYVTGPTAQELPAPTSDDPAIQSLLDKLTAALNQQKTDSEAIAAKSNLTVAALDALHQAIAGLDAEGLVLDKTATDAAVSSLVRAVAGQTDTTEAAAAFRALFADSGVTQEAIDTAISAVSRVVTESNLSVADLDTLKADKAAVDEAFQALRDNGYEPFQVAAQSGVAFGGDGGPRGRQGRPRKIATSVTTAGETTSKVSTTKETSTSESSTSNGSTKVRRVPVAALGRAGRFGTRGFAMRRAFGARF